MKTNEPIQLSEIVAFDLYFSMLMGNNLGKVSTKECAAKAIEMLTIRRTLIPTENVSDE